nr:hypothetical protein [Tanacetum cinerariifolium]
TKRVEENLHVEFLENKAIGKGAGPNWFFDIDSLTKSMNYVPVVVPGTNSTNLSGTKDAASQEVKKDVSSLRYIALPNRVHYALLESPLIYQMDVKSAFLYGTIDEEVYVMQPPGFQDLEFSARVYKVEKAMYGLHQDPRACDYGSAAQDRKSTTEGCQFLGRRLISWQCKKQKIVATSTTKAEYVAAASGCVQVLWIQNQLLDYGDCSEKKLISMEHIHTDENVADLLTKPFDVGRF